MYVPIQRVSTLIYQKRGVAAETTILLSKVLKTAPEFWMNLQNAVNLYEAAHCTLLNLFYLPIA